MSIFFPTYGGGHVNAIIPIVKELLNLEYEFNVLALTVSSHQLSTNDIPFLRVFDFFKLYNENELKLIKYFSNKYLESEIHEKADAVDIGNYIGLNLFDLSLRNDLKKVESNYLSDGRKTFLPLDFSARVLNYLKPSAVFVTCGQRMEKAMSIAAEEANIPVFRLVDLLGCNTIIDGRPTVLVMNELAKKNILKNNNKLTAVEVTGNPNFEYRKKVNNNCLFAKPNARYIISIFTQPGMPLGIKVIKSIASIVDEFPHFVFVLKPHPNENVCDYKELISENFLVITDYDANELISQSNAVFTFYSSVGFQAINQNKPLFILDFFNGNFPIDYSSLGAGVKVKNIEEFRCLLRKMEAGILDLSSEIRNYHLLQQPASSVDKIINILVGKF